MKTSNPHYALIIHLESQNVLVRLTFCTPTFLPFFATPEAKTNQNLTLQCPRWLSSSDPLTLTRHLLATQDAEKNGPGFPMLMASIQLACKTIAQAVRKAGIIGVLGLDGSTNSTGDDVKKLDLLSNDVFVNSLTFSRELCVLVTEDLEDPLVIEEALQGVYCVATDPLDGSSNIDCNVSTGTILECTNGCQGTRQEQKTSCDQGRN